MRMARIKMAGRVAVYHCVSRVVGRQRLLDDACKEMLVQLLWKLAAFYGLEVITYCMMDNHFHLLLRVPSQGLIDDSALLARLTAFYGPKGTLTTLAKEGLSERGRIDAEVRGRIVSRMGDISIFMQEFKQRFSRWYNRRHERDGVLWSERFRSVLIEDQPASVEAVAAYIDLNPVRAGLVDDPKEYRFCGYAAALAGNKLARKGLMSIQYGARREGMSPIPPNLTSTNSGANSRIKTESEFISESESEISSMDSFGFIPGTPVMPPASNHLQQPSSFANGASTLPASSAPDSAAQNPPSPNPASEAVPILAAKSTPAPSFNTWTDWSVCASEYRMRLFIRAGTTHQSGKATLSPDKIREVMQQGGQLSLGEICRLRLRHLTDGLAFGTQEFVNEVFTIHREKFSPKRQTGARPLPPFATLRLNTLRNLRARVWDKMELRLHFGVF